MPGWEQIWEEISTELNSYDVDTSSQILKE